MSKISIERNGNFFGPYTESQLAYYIENNKVLLNDIARIDSNPETMTLAKAMKKCNWRIPRAKNPWESFKKTGIDFIFPWQELKSMHWLHERRFLLLALIGLLPLGILLLTGGAVAYIAIAAYFSVLWGMFFFCIFKTDQVKLKECCRCFLVTALISTTALLIIHAFGLLAVAGAMADSKHFIIRFIGMFFAAGVPEEICKAAVIFWLVRRKGVICVPQTIVLYGLFSGLGFGINEGVCYQLGINHEQGVDGAYFLNVLRLTSLPFLHATWCGISSYFIAFAALVPMHRKGLWCIAILLPATIHALYNSMPQWACLLPASLGVILFTIYLTNAKNMKQKLT